MANVSDNAMFNSTIALLTTSGSPPIRLVSSGILATVGLIICTIGTCANAGVLAVLIKARRHFGNAVHTLIANQSAMDLFACVFAMVTLVMLLILPSYFKYKNAYDYIGDEILDSAICVLFEVGTMTTIKMIIRFWTK